MQNEEKGQRKRNIFFEFEQMYKDNNNISSELQRKNDIEYHNKIMESLSKLSIFGIFKSNKIKSFSSFLNENKASIDQ